MTVKVSLIVDIVSRVTERERSRRAVSAAVGVARVATCMPRLRSPIEDWLRLEIDVTTFLEAQGAPAVAPSAELPPGPHVADGFGVSFWTYLEPDPDRSPTTADCAAMLVDLHTALRSYPGELPLVCANDIPRGMELLDDAGDVLSAAEVDLLRASAERLAPFLAAPGGELQPLHGDAHPGNVIATRDGLKWIDFEDVCRGPIEWDLASMMDAGVVATHHRPDPDLLARCTQLRTLQVALALIVFYDEFGHQNGWDTALRDLLGTLATAS